MSLLHIKPMEKKENHIFHPIFCNKYNEISTISMLCTCCFAWNIMKYCCFGVVFWSFATSIMKLEFRFCSFTTSQMKYWFLLAVRLFFCTKYNEMLWFWGSAAERWRDQKTMNPSSFVMFFCMFMFLQNKAKHKITQIS